MSEHFGNLKGLVTHKQKFDVDLGDNYIRIFHLGGDNYIQIFHLGRYIIEYTVGNCFTAMRQQSRKT